MKKKRKRKPVFIPTQDEIAQRAKEVREKGFVNEEGMMRRPWDDKKYGIEPEVEMPIVPEKALMPELDPTWDSMKGL